MNNNIGLNTTVSPATGMPYVPYSYPVSCPFCITDTLYAERGSRLRSSFLLFSRFCVIMVVMKHSATTDMVNGPLFSGLMKYAWPLMIANALQIFFHTADTIIIGRFCGEKALAAVGSTTPVTIFFTWGFAGLSVGADVLIARMLGAKEKPEKITAAVQTCMIIAVAGGILITTAGIAGSSAFMNLLHTPADILPLSLTYLRIYFLSAFSIGVFDFAAAVLRSGGDTVRPTICLSLCGLLNVILNLIFVIYFHWDVAGVAVASVISQALACIAVMMILLNEESVLKLHTEKWLFDRRSAAMVLHTGIPSALQNMLFSVSNMVVQSGINSFGSTAVAGNAAANAIEEYVYVFVDSFPHAAVTFTGQAAGARKPERIRKILITCLCVCTAGALSIGMICSIFSDPLLALFTAESTVIAAGRERLYHVTLFLFMNGILDIIVSSMRGMNYSAVPAAVTMIGICGIRLSYIFLVFPHYGTLGSLYMCFPLSWLITSLIQFCLWIRVYRRQL